MKQNMKELRTVSQKRGYRIGIQWKMYAILIVFIGIVVGVIWFFQVQLMNYFYQLTRFKELELSATAITAELSSPKRTHEVSEELSSEYDMDIWVYQIDEFGSAYLITEAKGTGESSISFKGRKFSVLHDKAQTNDGTYIAMVSMEAFYDSVELEILQDNDGDASAYPVLVNYSNEISAVYVELREENSKDYMIIQSTNLTPVRAMVDTLKNQALSTGLILSILALMMAWLMSRLITKPIVKMNDAAKRLAEGRYDANFSGRGYREIEELADTLNYASEELAKTDRLQKELISNVSHDLRTPLTMIKGYGEVMRDIPGENTPENVQIIIDETSRLSGLVNDMLDLSRMQAGSRKPVRAFFSLTEVVRHTLKRYERLTKQDGYQIDFQEDGDAVVLADQGMILQVIYNLINNAINYTGEDKRVLVRQERLGKTVRISVHDTGEGIAEDDLPMIWERYYKVDKVHRRATVGTGLGLSIVKEILEAHNSRYGVQSAKGEGSVFWFEMEIALLEEKPDYIEADYEEGGTMEE